MSETWKITALASRDAVQNALVAHEDVLDWPEDIVIAGSEVAEDRPEEWRLEAWLPRQPSDADRVAFIRLFAIAAPEFIVEQLPETDWISLSQQGLEPIRAGRFFVHTPDYPPSQEPGVRDFVIPASRAFGTGHHATTAGCLAMLTAMKRRGVIARNFADIGTGSGLLAFAALDLWPRALGVASDIDAVCLDVLAENARANGVRLGDGPGALTPVVADGLGHPLLAARAPYDLLIANILAWPLIALAPDFAAVLVPGGHLLLAGLLDTQEPHVRAACRRAGLRLAAREVRGGWSILWLRKRATARVRQTRPGQLPEWARQW